jgi:hypothetical protein
MNQGAAHVFALWAVVAAVNGCGGDAPAESPAPDGAAGAEAGDSQECAAVARMRPPEYYDLGFFETLTFVSEATYLRPASLQGLVEKSERVFLGRIEGVAPGNLYSNQPGVPAVLCSRGARHTTNIVFQVTSEVRGHGPNRVVVEWTHSRLVFLRDLERKIPGEEMLVFVNNIRNYPLPTGASPGAFDSELFYLSTSLGLITDVNDGLGFPLEARRDWWLPIPATEIQEVAASLRLP